MSKVTILLIDDDPLVLRSFEKVLAGDGYHVVPVNGYEAAMVALRENKIDLVLTDIRMPEKDGVSTAKEIQEVLLARGQKELPVIFITGYGGEEIKLHAPFVGETLYKPIDVQQLLSVIRDYL
jgi:DNA-binding NtrC family response regulator